MEEFYRIRRLPPYVFEQVNRAKAAARNAGADIIDLGMGNPDLPTPPHVIEKLKETLGKPRTDRYSASRGITGLRRAQAAYYDRRFGVKLNPETQVVATLGSKEGFANVAQAITAPGDVILCPNPSYPIHAFGFLMAGGVIQGFTVKVQAATEAERVRAIMAIAVEGERSGAVLRALRGFPEVKAVHMTNGRWDMIAELNTDSLAGFSRALDAVRLVEGISATETSLLLTTHRM